MPRKIVPMTSADRERLKERVKTLIYAGHNVREASEMCGVEETTALVVRLAKSRYPATLGSVTF